MSNQVLAGNSGIGLGISQTQTQIMPLVTGMRVVDSRRIWNNRIGDLGTRLVEVVIQGLGGLMIV